MKVGFIGFGRMGQAMAARLLGGGHELVVYNRTREKCAELEKAGAKVAASMAEACKGREVVISMVTDDKALIEVVEGDLGRARQGRDPRRDGHAQRARAARDRCRARQSAGRCSSRRRCSAGPKPPRRARSPSCRRARGRHREGRAAECADGPAHVPGRHEARRRGGREAREQHGDRLRDRGDGRGVLARAQVRRRSGDVLRGA